MLHSDNSYARLRDNNSVCIYFFKENSKTHARDYETDTLYSNTNGLLLKRAYQLHADDDRVILTYTCKQQNFIHLLYV